MAGASSDAIIFIWGVGDGRLLRKIANAHGVLAGQSAQSRTEFRGGDARRAADHVGRADHEAARGDASSSTAPRTCTMSEVRFWDIETGERIADYHGDEDYGFGYGALSRDGRRVAVADFSRLRILDAATGRPSERSNCPARGASGPRSRPMGRSSPCRSTTPSGSSRFRPGGGCTTTRARPSAMSSRRRGRHRAIGSSPAMTTGSCGSGTPRPAS